MLSHTQLVHFFRDFFLLSMKNTVVIRVLVDVDDTCRQGALFFLRHAGAPGSFVISVSVVAYACFLGLLLQLRHCFHVAWRET